LIKRLSKHTSPKSITQLHLVAPARNSKKHPLYTFASKKKDMKHITKQTQYIHIYHSSDDTVCDYADSELIHSLLPWSQLHTFHDRWHFRQETFPELINNINDDKK
jgi:predicted alpha/beta hydrolase family esterase